MSQTTTVKCVFIFDQQDLRDNMMCNITKTDWYFFEEDIKEYNLRNDDEQEITYEQHLVGKFNETELTRVNLKSYDEVTEMFNNLFCRNNEESDEESDCESIDPDNVSEDEEEEDNWCNVVTKGGIVEHWAGVVYDDVYSHSITDSQAEQKGSYGISKKQYVGLKESNNERVFMYEHFVKYHGQERKSFWSHTVFTLDMWSQYALHGSNVKYLFDGVCDNKVSMINYLLEKYDDLNG